MASRRFLVSGSLNGDQELHYRDPGKKIWLMDGTAVTFIRFDAAPVFGCVAIGICGQTPDDARTIEFRGSPPESKAKAAMAGRPTAVLCDPLRDRAGKRALSLSRVSFRTRLRGWA